MQAVLAALAEQHAELDGLLAGFDADGWSRPTPCEGWDVADVVLHLSQTDALAIASASGRFAAGLDELAGRLGPAGSVDEGAALMVERERGADPDALLARWRAGAEELRRVLAACAPADRVTWVAGELSARTLATTRLAEAWIHTGDVAAALGRTLAPGDRLWHVARLAWRTIPYAFARAGEQLHGPVAFELIGPSGDRWDLRPDEPAVTTIRGDGVELCRLAGQRTTPEATGLRGDGPDAAAVLALVRTYA